ncbi:HEAT repeat domain-containing protein [Microcoleus sp. FACHB-68]|uniref:HEAT repeat domain-containing protein n=1 Tax=Microcoleus sp. FACHB-68 TaxID=2692826 RepID=UPI001682CB65|nr:HEAT repeat domain-containing protein [Microcoleus sp. FACHB-68]MBD1937009.1 HEAT repeat domain-containing protein [Microcoleus sp. FACHB-68]
MEPLDEVRGNFLAEIADAYKLHGEPKHIFFQRFAYQKDGKHKDDKNFAKDCGIEATTLSNHMQEIYKAFAKSPEKPHGCDIDLNKRGRGKFNKLYGWLWTEQFRLYTDDNGLWKQQLPASKILTTLKSSLESATAINWQEVCRAMLEEEKKQWLTTHSLRGCGDRRIFDMYVPLGLVERQAQPPRPAPHTSPESGSQLYQEKVTPIEHKKFFEQVIKQGQSPKSQGRRIANIGEPGAGKTTLLQILAFKVLENGGLPIWIDLANLGCNETLEDYLLNKWLRQALRIIRKFSATTIPSLRQVPEKLKDDLVEEFYKDRVWLLLDGVDEMATELGNPLTLISQQLSGSWVAEARVILSCRLNVWEADKNALGNFDVYRNLDFSYPDQVQEFINKWFAQASDKAQGLWRELEQSSERIRDLIKNPLRLTLLCRTWYLRQGKLPDTKAGLYQQLVKAHYTWKDDHQEFEISPKEQEELNQKLGVLAKAAIAGEDSRFRLRESFVKGLLGEPNQESSLFWWALKLGWLNRVGLATAEEKDPDEKVYAFFHPTFQEYFAACAIDDWHFFLNHNNENPNPFLKHNGTDCVYRIFEAQWKEVILLWLGREGNENFKSQKNAFLQALVEFQDGCNEFFFGDCKGFYDYRAYFLAAAGIAEFKEANLASEIIQEILKWGFGTEVKEGSYSDEIYKQCIKNGTRQGYAPDKIGKQAKAILKETDRRMAIDGLVALICTTPLEVIRREVVESLGDISRGNSEVKAMLIELINHSPDSFTRMKAAENLGKIDPGNEQAIATLIHLKHNSVDDFTRFEAPVSLGKIAPDHSEAAKFAEPTLFLEYAKLGQFDLNDPELIALLVEEIRDNFNELYNFAILLNSILDGDTLMQGHQMFSEIKLKPNVYKALLLKLENVYNHKLGFRCSQAVQNLGYTTPGNSDAIKVLIDVIKTSADKYILVEALRSLARIGKSDPKVIALLIKLIHNCEEKSIRHQAVINLWHTETSHEDAIWALMDVMRAIPPDNLNRYTAAQNLGQILQRYPLSSAVSALKDYLITLIVQQDFDFYTVCYNHPLLDCAQVMPYPDYYQAWHRHPSIPSVNQ